MNYPARTNLASPGNLNGRRFEIVKEISSIVKTGDILVRLGNSSYFGIPIEKLIALVTKSKYSHVSLIIVEDDGEICVFEVNEYGTQKLRLIDWIPYINSNFAIYRTNVDSNIKSVINNYIDLDLEYDFTFDDDKKLYCTEAVSFILEASGVEIPPSKSAKELMPRMTYNFFLLVNKLSKLITGKAFSLNPLYFVGNSEHGLLSIKNLIKIYEVEI